MFTTCFIEVFSIHKYRDISRLIWYGILLCIPESSDFGDGFYTNPSIIYALKHIRIIRNSTLLIFNWKDLGGNNITTGYINKDEWISTVKGYICINDITKPELPNYG